MIQIWWLLAALQVVPDPVDLAVGDTVQLRVLQDGRVLSTRAWEGRLEQPNVVKLLPGGRIVGLQEGYVLMHVRAGKEETVTLVRVSRTPERPRRGEIRLNVGEDLELPDADRTYRILPPDLGQVRNGVLHALREGWGLLLVFRGERPAGLRRLRFGHPRRATYVLPVTEASRFFPGEDNLFLEHIPAGVHLRFGSLPENRLHVQQEGDRLWLRCERPGRALLWLEIQGAEGTQFLARPIRCLRVPSGRTTAVLHLGVGKRITFPLPSAVRVRLQGEGVHLRRSDTHVELVGERPGVALLLVQGRRGPVRAVPVVVGLKVERPVQTYWLPRRELGRALKGEVRILGDPRVRVAKNGQIQSPPRLRVQPTVVVEREGSHVSLTFLRQIPAPVQKWRPRASARERFQDR